MVSIAHLDALPRAAGRRRHRLARRSSRWSTLCSPRRRRGRARWWPCAGWSRHAGVERAVCAVVDGESGRLYGLTGIGVTLASVDALQPRPGGPHPPAGRGPVRRRAGRSSTTPASRAAGLRDPAGQPLLPRRAARQLERGDRPRPAAADRPGGRAGARRRPLGGATARRAPGLALVPPRPGGGAAPQAGAELAVLDHQRRHRPDPARPTPTAASWSPTPAPRCCSPPARTKREGWRRAVALNNMLFSASLFTNAAESGPTRRELLLVDPSEGQDLLFEVLSTPVPIRLGEIGVVSVLRNVTDLRRATEEIEENYRRLRVAEAATARRARPPRPDPQLGARPHPGHRSGGQHRAHEPAGRAHVHLAARQARASRSSGGCAPTTRCSPRSSPTSTPARRGTGAAS